MKCFQHPDLDAVGVCASCGKGVCQSCAVEFQGRVRCKECVKQAAPVTSAQAEPRRGGVVRLSKAFYLGSILGAGVVGTIFYLIGIVLFVIEMERWRPNWGPTIVFFAIGLVLLLYTLVIWLRLVYKMWQSIQDGHARTTPGRAVGFLFIPFYNFYWIFQAYWGFAKDCNQYVVRRNAAAPRLPEGLFLAFCILTLVSAVPYVGWIVGIPNAVIGIIIVVKICDAVNSLPQPGAV